MNRAKREEYLAALLDGELRDHSQVEKLNHELEADSQLMAEFEEQREIKTLLAQLPEFEAPHYMPTRVMGEISARKRNTRRTNLGYLASALGGFTLCLLAFSLALPNNQANNNLVMANGESAIDPHTIHIIQPTLGNGQPQAMPVSSVGRYIPVDYSGNEELDPEVQDFLRFACEAHRDAELMFAADDICPMPAEAVSLIEPNVGGE